MSLATSLRLKTTGFLYKRLLKPAFFRMDPETVHDRITLLGTKLGNRKAAKSLTRKIFYYKNPALEQKICRINFENPVGLAAGFDKNGLLQGILPSIGFGFAEIGSVTGKPCAGNPKPRLWRLPRSKSLAVYYGLKNDGCETVAGRLTDKMHEIPLGASIAMTNCKENLNLEKAISDYEKAFKIMEPVADYLTINISCPNSEGGMPFLSPEKLDLLLGRLDKTLTLKPVFLKLSPDLDLGEVDEILHVAENHKISGVICANLTKKPDKGKILDEVIPGKGGLSGKVVQEKSDALLSHIYGKFGKKFVLIGCGGVFSPEDAYRKIRLGASLVQMITGLIFEGPQVVAEINAGLPKLLARDGFTNIREAIGADNC